MNKLLLIGLLGLSFMADAQDRRIPTVAPVTGVPGVAQPNAPELPRFDLDFPGGDVEEFVQALNKGELDGRLNVIIPDDAKHTKIPPMKMKGVNVSQVFEALQRASRRLVPVRGMGTRFLSV